MPINERISLETVLVRRSDLMVSELSEDELVMLSVPRSAYFGVDATAKVIWDQLSEPRSVRDLVDYLLTHFAVDRQTCEREVLDFAHEMVRHDLVQVIDITP